MPSHYFILLTLKPYPYSAKLYSYYASGIVLHTNDAVYRLDYYHYYI